MTDAWDAFFTRDGQRMRATAGGTPRLVSPGMPGNPTIPVSQQLATQLSSRSRLGLPPIQPIRTVVDDIVGGGTQQLSSRARLGVPPLTATRAPVAGPFMSNPVPVSIRNAGARVGGPLSMADDLAAQLGSRGRNVASKFGLAFKPDDLFNKADDAARGAARGAFKSSALKGLGYGIAGNVAGNMLGGDDTFLGRLVKGAGTGAGLGSFLGTPGAIAGAVGGGLLSAFGVGGDDGGTKWLEDETLDRAGFTEQDKNEIRLMHDILKDTMSEEEANAQIGQMIMADIQGRSEAETQGMLEQQRMLSTQALAAQFFQPFTQQMMDSAQQRYAMSESLADNLPPEYRAIAQQQNIASLDNANRVATAYAAQAQMIPAMAAMEYQMGIADQLAQQQAAGVMAQLGLGGAGGGATSLTDLASQIALQGQGQ